MYTDTHVIKLKWRSVSVYSYVYIYTYTYTHTHEQIMFALDPQPTYIHVCLLMHIMHNYPHTSLVRFRLHIHTVQKATRKRQLTSFWKFAIRSTSSNVYSALDFPRAPGASGCALTSCRKNARASVKMNTTWAVGRHTTVAVTWNRTVTVERHTTVAVTGNRTVSVVRHIRATVERNTKSVR